MGREFVWGIIFVVGMGVLLSILDELWIRTRNERIRKRIYAYRKWRRGDRDDEG